MSNSKRDNCQLSASHMLRGRSGDVTKYRWYQGTCTATQQPGAADTPPQRRATGRATSSNKWTAGNDVVARKVVLCSKAECVLVSLLYESKTSTARATSSWGTAGRMAEANGPIAGKATSDRARHLPESVVAWRYCCLLWWRNHHDSW